MNRHLIIASLLTSSSWQASSNGIAEGDIRSAVLLSDDGSSPGTAFLTDFFFEAYIRSRHSWHQIHGVFFFLEDITVM